ncbi:hypothetical protein LT335_00318 [Spiroplasma sp. JKS002669]|uniref:hypothetical protein n=1 Tax=Spiroplasma attinicola TaxID=2904537 RepID=UPI002022BA4B|nr:MULTISPECIES: hypothetical protein [unclassified Spiroplasma]MCL6428770.1 hypothetical protein [Spiroplasma sp. JKS002669]MCL8210236.1 hypothetical protein [Spiroplasma sp. JKS002670]MCL8210745.1 hypothetical protein [Spiroplasma sp. JKS002671]
MVTMLSILATISFAGFLFCLLKLRKLKKIKKTNLAEPIANKKWRRILIYAIFICLSIFILVASLFLSLFS